MTNQFDMKMESLQRQVEFLTTLRGRHLAWAGNLKVPEAKRKHLEIATILEELIKQYQAILEIYTLQAA